MITVALDAMGGDHGLEATIDGAAYLSTESTDIRMLLVGDTAAMTRRLDQVRYDPSRITLVDATGVVKMDDKPAEALDRMPDCSILTAARLVRDGHAQALVSAGSTGATILAAARTFGMLPGVRRAALASLRADIVDQRMQGAMFVGGVEIADEPLAELRAGQVDQMGFQPMDRQLRL